MKNTKTLSLVLLMALLASLASCGGDAPSNDTTVPTDTTAVDTEPAVQPPDIEKCDYQGAEFNIYAPAWGSYSAFWHAEEQTGDAMDDALYERNRLVEEYLGIDVTFTNEGGINDMAAMLQSMVMAGDDAYQLVLTHCIAGLGTMITDNLLYPWNELPHVDLEREYWNQSINTNMNLYGKQCLAVSDYMIKMPYCFYFNTQMIEDYNLENPYDLVREGKWTLDKLLEMSEAAYKDLNGDSQYDVNDQFGFVAQADSPLNSFIYACGLSLTERNDEGGLDLVISNERTYTMVEKLDKIINGSDSTFFWAYSATADQQVHFKDGKALFFISSTDGLRNTREWEIDFGVLPYPKLDEAQEKYMTNDWGGFMTVPTSVSDPEMVGKAAEMFSYFSGETTIPTYYQLMMGEKFARDADAKEMLDLIFDSIVYDSGNAFFGFGGGMAQLFYMPPRLIWATGEGNFASWYDTYGPEAEQMLKDFLEDAKENAEQ